MSKLVTIGALVGALTASASAAGHGVRALNSCSSISPQRSGGISEMASCGSQGIRGNRAQFVKAIKRPVGNRAFLSQLAH